VKIKTKNIILIIFAIVFFFGTFILFKNEQNVFAKKIKDFLPDEIKTFLKKTIFYLPYTVRENKNLNHKLNIYLEENNKLILKNFGLENLNEHSKFNEENFSLNKKVSLKLESFILPFYSSENFSKNKKSGYFEISDEDIWVAFASGKIIYFQKNNFFKKKLNFIEVKNNLEQIVKFRHETKWTGIKDIFIFNNKIYASSTNEVTKDCFNLVLLVSEIDKNFLNFNKIFETPNCINIKKIEDRFRYFNGYQTSGKILINQEKLYLSIGDFNQWELPQNIDNYFGKLIQINILNYDIPPKIISIGHRNSQGMTFLKNDNDKILATEHGPKGGDELNLINLNLINNEVQNFGWPISSYGYHYDVVPLNSKTKKIAPLYKSHTKYNFKEPTYYFKDSIGLSQITRNFSSLLPGDYLVTSLKEKKLYNFTFAKINGELILKDTINIHERIRDIKLDKEDKNVYYLYLEDTPKILKLTFYEKKYN
jgi:hypothetical protein